MIGGATISGIENPNSKTQTGLIISTYLENKVQSNHAVLLCLGEVDCGFVIWYRAEKYAENIEPYFQKALENYYSLLLKVKSKALKVIVSSIPLPTIKDGIQDGWVAQARGDVKATLRQRTDLTMKFNKKMKEHCNENEIEFLDLESKIVDENTMLIDPLFLNLDKTDHHLSDSAYSQVVLEGLKNIAIY